MRFAVPTFHLVVWLLAAPTLAAIVFAAVAVGRRRSARAAFAGQDLMARLSPGGSIGRLRGKYALVVVTIIFVGLAAGRPQVGTRMGVAKRRGVDLMIAIDTSASMRARDLRPDRLERAKRGAASLIGRLDGDRVGIITFSGESFVQCPLTLDYSAAAMLLSAVETGVIPVPGTALGAAIRRATEAMSTQPERSKVLVLMTDGEDHGSEPLEAASAAAGAGIRVYTIGLGSTAGEPIPLSRKEGGGHKRDSDGQIVMSRLDEGTLVDVAEATGGRYFRATEGERELEAIAEAIAGMEQGELESQMFSYYEERFQIPLAAGLVLLLLDAFIPARRRRRTNRGT